ncbi:MAG: lysophospholipid acyltransferase family protein [Halothiobacillaceae bacterium]
MKQSHPARAAMLRVGLGLARALARLPRPWLLALGRAMGPVMYRLGPKRRHIANTNLRLCFPELNERQRRTLLRAHYNSLGQGLAEVIWGWWARQDDPPEWSIEGWENLEAAREDGRGVLLYTGHLTCMELGAGCLAQQLPLGVIYRPNRNPIINEAIDGGRARHVTALYAKDQTMRMVRALRRGDVLWIAPDQNYGRAQSAMLPFFDIPCATNIAVPHLARLGRARILPFFVHRTAGGFHLRIEPPLDNLPSGDDAADTRRLTARLEAHIREHPEDYLWGHRRFKNLADGQPSPYDSATRQDEANQLEDEPR